MAVGCLLFIRCRHGIFVMDFNDIVLDDDDDDDKKRKMIIMIMTTKRCFNYHDLIREASLSVSRYTHTHKQHKINI